ncbi:MAG TPA: fibronectin type III domain-containing protein [Steroidobacteraceae bacterium]|nr:fibronectin type III domain-containing protein [Steroidobacteraceae bacterium]
MDVNELAYKMSTMRARDLRETEAILRSARGLVVAFALIAALVACGGGAGSASPPPPPPPTTGSVTLTWTIPTLNTDGSQLTNLMGFKVIYGMSSTNLTQSLSIDGSTVGTCQIDNLTSGTWYFAVISVASDGTQSAPSNVLSQTI